MEGFVDISTALGGGVYLLVHRGEVVFVGKASRGMISRIEAHRSLARKKVQPWVPIKGIVFDRVFIRYVHPDQIDEIYTDLVAELRPRHNLPPPSLVAAQQIERRAL